MDLVSDQLVTGRRFRALAVVDAFSRVSPCILAATSISGETGRPLPRRARRHLRPADHDRRR
jgi:hypothetical protein